MNGIKNAQLLQVGKKLRISANSHAKAQRQTKYVKHKVRRGQTLGSIARRYGTTVSILKRLNGVINVKRLQVGQILRIPRG
jgi:LysM repeat protein